MEEEGMLRLLTPGEVGMARAVFRDSIEYHKVWVHRSSYFPFGLQPENAGLAPNGELYFRAWYTPDFSLSDLAHRHIFIHEMSHVWQRGRGMNVQLNGLVSMLVSYRYVLNGRPLRRYPMEQQAQIITDWHVLNTYGYIAWRTLRERGDITLDGDLTESVIRSQYQKTLHNFPWC